MKFIWNRDTRETKWVEESELHDYDLDEGWRCFRKPVAPEGSIIAYQPAGSWAPLPEAECLITCPAGKVREGMVWFQGQWYLLEDPITEKERARRKIDSLARNHAKRIASDSMKVRVAAALAREEAQ